MIGDAESTADHVRKWRYCVNNQMSIFSAISMAA